MGHNGREETKGKGKELGVWSESTKATSGSKICSLDVGFQKSLVEVVDGRQVLRSRLLLLVGAGAMGDVVIA